MTIAPIEAAGIGAAVPGGLRGVGYTGQVELLGRLGRRVADAASTYGSLSDDDVLHGFRKQAGLRAPGSPMTGWAAETSQMTFGQWVSGLARLGATLQDRSLTNKAVALLHGYGQTLPTDGTTGMNIYAWEKLICGLADAIDYCGDTDAPALLVKIARAERFDRTRATAIASDFSGQEPHFSIEWYTLSENLYKGARLTGNGDLAQLAAQWHYDAYWDRFREAPAPGTRWRIPPWLHAYSHVNTFASAAAAYEANGDQGLLAVLRNAFAWLTTTQVFATGGFGPHEFTMPEDGTLGRCLEWLTDSAEIVCGSWALFKLITALLKHTGDARYLDLAERLVYNGIGATIPVRPDGRSPYYADYRLGVATKLPYWHAWPCCSGTYLQAVAHLHDLVYFSADDGVAVGLYVPSRFSWDQEDVRVTMSQDTVFPAAEDTRLRLTMAAPIAFKLHLRVPAWSRFEARVNDRPVEMAPRPDQWVTIDRRWESGDTVTVRLGPRLRAESVDEFHPNRAAVMFGPVVLVQDVDWHTPFDVPVPWQMLDWESHLARESDELVFVPTQPGTHRMPPGGFRPFYELPERAPYRMYHDFGSRRII
ncbi:MAG: glycoside hydrolase family 127 protein [Bifidobacteriaceae bacterium]|nr:glycoside hydrolase family 127 protein [Bifidobacteriaceae bacterium]